MRYVCQLLATFDVSDGTFSKCLVLFVNIIYSFVDFVCAYFATYHTLFFFFVLARLFILLVMIFFAFNFSTINYIMGSNNVICLIVLFNL